MQSSQRSSIYEAQTKEKEPHPTQPSRRSHGTTLTHPGGTHGQTCVGLEELYLSHNGIEVMEGLSTLVNLNTLDITANKLTRVQGLGCNTRCARAASCV